MHTQTKWHITSLHNNIAFNTLAEKAKELIKNIVNGTASGHDWWMVTIHQQRGHGRKQLAEKKTVQNFNHNFQTQFKNFRWQLVVVVERQLLGEHVAGILGKGLAALLDAPRLHDLATLYTLFSRVKDGLAELCHHFNGYIKVYFWIRDIWL